jgi:hypothetical protein
MPVMDFILKSTWLYWPQTILNEHKDDEYYCGTKN